MPRDVHLVGSVPGENAADVFERVSAALGPHLKRIPDGETGERADWIIWLEPVFANSPALEKSDELFRLHATATRRIRYRLKAGRSARTCGSTICSTPTSPSARTRTSRGSSARARYRPVPTSRSIWCRPIR